MQFRREEQQRGRFISHLHASCGLNFSYTSVVGVASSAAALWSLGIPFATNLYVREVGAFNFCVGLAWLARCVLPYQPQGAILILLVGPDL